MLEIIEALNYAVSLRKSFNETYMHLYLTVDMSNNVVKVSHNAGPTSSSREALRNHHVIRLASMLENAGFDRQTMDNTLIWKIPKSPYTLGEQF